MSYQEDEGEANATHSSSFAEMPTALSKHLRMLRFLGWPSIFNHLQRNVILTIMDVEPYQGWVPHRQRRRAHCPQSRICKQNRLRMEIMGRRKWHGDPWLGFPGAGEMLICPGSSCRSAGQSAPRSLLWRWWSTGRSAHTSWWCWSRSCLKIPSSPFPRYKEKASSSHRVLPPVPDQRILTFLVKEWSESKYVSESYKPRNVFSGPWSFTYKSLQKALHTKSLTYKSFTY